MGSSTVGQNNQGGTIVNREGKGSREAWRPDQTGKTNRGLGDTGVRKTVNPYSPPTVVTTPPPAVVPTVKAPITATTSNTKSTIKYGPISAQDYSGMNPGSYSPPGGVVFDASKNPNSAGKVYSTVSVGKTSGGGTSVGNWGPTSDAGKSLPSYK